MARRRRFVYVALFASLFFAYLYLRDSSWRGDIALHTLMAAVATVLALAVGSLVLVCFAIVAFVPMPAAYYQKLPFLRPQEFLPALFFLLALIGYCAKSIGKPMCSNSGWY